MTDWSKSSKRFPTKEPSPTPGPTAYEIKMGLLDDSQAKHFGFLGKTERFPPGHPEHVPEFAPAVEDVKPPPPQNQKPALKRASSLAESHISKEFERFKNTTARNELAHKKTLALLEERAAKLEASNATLLKEKIAVMSGMKLKDREIADLTRRTTVLKGNLERSEKNAQAQLDKLNSGKTMAKRVEELERLNARATSCQEKLQESLDSVQEKLQQSLRQVADLKQAKDHAELKIEQIAGELSDSKLQATAELETLQQRFDSIVEKNQVLAEERVALETAISAKETEIFSSQAEIQGLKTRHASDLERAYENVKSLEAEKKDLSAAISSVREEYAQKCEIEKSRDQKMDVLQSDLASSQDRAASLAATIESLELELKDSVSMLECKLQEETIKSTEIINSLKSDKESLKMENGELNALVETRDSQLKAQESEMTKAKDQIREMGNSFALRHQQLQESLEEQTAALQQRHEKIQSKLAEFAVKYQETIESHNQSDKACRAEIGRLEDAKSELELELAKEKDALTETFRDLNDVKKELDGSKAQCLSLEQELESVKSVGSRDRKEADQASLEQCQQIADLEVEGAGMKQQIDDLTVENVKTKQELTQSKETIHQLESRLEKDSSALEETELLRTRLEETVKKGQEDIARLSKDEIAYREQITSLESKLGDLKESSESSISSLKDDMSKAEVEFAEKIAEFEKEIQGRLESEDALKQEIVELQTIGSEKEVQMKELQSSLHEAESSIASLNSELDIKISDLAALESIRKGLDKDVETLNEKLASSESLYTRTQTQFDAFKKESGEKIFEMEEMMKSDLVRFDKTLAETKKEYNATIENLESNHSDNLVAMQASIDRVSASLKEKTRESEIQADTIGGLERKISEAEMIMSSKTKDWEAERAASLDAYSKLEASYSELEGTLADVSEKLEFAESQLAKTKKNLVDMEAANKEINDRFAQSKEEMLKMMKSMEQERESSNQKTLELRKANQTLREEKSLIEQNHHNELNIAKTENHDMANKIDSLENSLRTSEKELEETESRLIDTEREKDELKKDLLAEIEGLSQELEAIGNSHESQIAQMHDRLMKAENRSQAGADQLNVIMQEKSRLEDLVKMLEMKHANQISGKESQIRSLEEQVANSAGKLEAQKKGVEDLLFVKHENRQMQYDLDMIKGENAMLERRLQDTHSNDQHERRAIRNQLDTRNAEINILKSEREK
ncbi:MAG: hypothetical protein SGCHY_003623 [Lobulomycetales sp.]